MDMNRATTTATEAYDLAVTLVESGAKWAGGAPAFDLRFPENVVIVQDSLESPSQFVVRVKRRLAELRRDGRTLRSMRLVVERAVTNERVDERCELAKTIAGFGTPDSAVEFHLC